MIALPCLPSFLAGILIGGVLFAVHLHNRGKL